MPIGIANILSETEGSIIPQHPPIRDKSTGKKAVLQHSA